MVKDPRFKESSKNNAGQRWGTDLHITTTAHHLFSAPTTVLGITNICGHIQAWRRGTL